MIEVKTSIIVMAFVLLGLGAGACGGSSGSAGLGSRSLANNDAIGGSTVATTSNIRSVHGYIAGDDDMENDDRPKSDDDVPIRKYGHLAGAADERRVAALLERYYSIAATGNGAAACALIYPKLAKNPSHTRTIPDDRFSGRLGPPALPGESCARVASRQFEQNHRRLVTDTESLQVTGMRVDGPHAVALLAFRTTPERWMPVARDERGVWKIASVLDREMP